MSVDSNTSVTNIVGIGPVIAGKLNAAGVWSIFDMLAVSFADVYGPVRSIASATEVRNWIRMATLLQVAEVTPQLAEALVRHRVTTIEELQRNSVHQLHALFRFFTEFRERPRGF
jgi:hypothetical protein